MKLHFQFSDDATLACEHPRAHPVARLGLRIEPAPQTATKLLQQKANLFTSFYSSEPAAQRT